MMKWMLIPVLILAAAAAAAVEPTRQVLIPAGSFMMGKDGESDHAPAHIVELDAFYLDATEVTNAQYAAFCAETETDPPFFWGMQAFHCGPDYPDHPVVGVSWYDARNYAEWLGRRLPTEAEWEYAARGGLVGRNYSHGDTLNAVQYAPTGNGTSPVGGYPPNGFGLHDMTGNVVEWVSDWYDRDYYAAAPIFDPPGPGAGKFKVIRGGGWKTGPACARVYHRTALQSNWVDFNVGFRCARNVE